MIEVVFFISIFNKGVFKPENLDFWRVFLVRLHRWRFKDTSYLLDTPKSAWLDWFSCQKLPFEPTLWCANEHFEINWFLLLLTQKRFKNTDSFQRFFQAHVSVSTCRYKVGVIIAFLVVTSLPEGTPKILLKPRSHVIGGAIEQIIWCQQIVEESTSLANSKKAFRWKERREISCPFGCMFFLGGNGQNTGRFVFVASFGPQGIFGLL